MFCRFFGNKTECLYCGIVSEKPSRNVHYRKYFASTPEEIAEVAGAAYDGPMAVREMQITGGVMPNLRSLSTSSRSDTRSKNGWAKRSSPTARLWWCLRRTSTT
jgi:hypothetical protein